MYRLEWMKQDLRQNALVSGGSVLFSPLFKGIRKGPASNDVKFNQQADAVKHN